MSDKTVKITFEIDGIQKEVASIEELQKEMSKLGKETKKAADQQGFIGEKLDGLKSTFGKLKGDFKVATKGIKTFFASGTTGAKVLKLALASLGIPLLIAAVVALINYFKNFEVVTRTISKAMNALGAIVANVGQAFKLLISGDFAGAFNVMKDAVVEAVEATDNLYDSAKRLNEIQQRNAIQNAKLKQEIEGYKKILEDTTASEEDRLKALDEVTKRTKLLAQAQLEENQAAIDGLEAKIKLENNEVARRDLELELAELRAERINQQTELNNIEFDAAKVGREIRQQQLDEEQAAADARKAIRDKEAADKEAEAETARQKEEARQAALDQKMKDLHDQELVRMTEEGFARAAVELQLQEEKELAELTRLEATEEQKAVVERKYAAKHKALKKAQADSDIAFQEMVSESNLQIASQGLGAVSKLVGENTAAGKASAVAATTIDTYLGAQKAYTSQLIPGDPTSPLRAAVAAGVAVAAGLANVKAILSTKTPGTTSGGGGGSTPTRPSIPTFDPTVALGQGQEGIDIDSTETIGQQSVAGAGNNVVKAYVVAEDVTSQQEAIGKINDLARL
jgi:hypothetical protein